MMPETNRNLEQGADLSPDFWFELSERQPETPHGTYLNWFLGTKFPINFSSISIIRQRFSQHATVILTDEDIKRGFEESGNLVGLMHWQREKNALNFTGIGVSADRGIFYDPSSGEHVSLKEVKKLKRQQQHSKVSRFLARIGV